MNRTQLSAVFLIGWSAQAIFLFVMGAEFGWMFWVYLFGFVTACAAAWIGSAPNRKARRLAKVDGSIAAIERDVDRPLLDVVKAAEVVVVDGWLKTPEGGAWVKRRKEVLAAEALDCEACMEVLHGRVRAHHEATRDYSNRWLQPYSDPPRMNWSGCCCPEHTFDAHREMAKTFPAVSA